MAGEIASALGTDPDAAISAALIAKADLSSEMVYEFAELQGIMGEHYARAAGYSDEVARVAREHYQPLGPSDDVPNGHLSIAVALADKIDTLAGFWAMDEKPTGSKDPFALRRAALGVIRLILETTSGSSSSRLRRSQAFGPPWPLRSMTPKRQGGARRHGSCMTRPEVTLASVTRISPCRAGSSNSYMIA